MKVRRQQVILDIIDREAVSSQQELQRHLHRAGIEATQATISRDLKELGLVKAAGDGAYQRSARAAGDPDAARLALERAVGSYLVRVEQAQQIVVIGTGPGQAQPLAVAVDRAGLPGLVGTVAGDDTILAVCRTARDAAAIARRLERLASG